jgi:tryptophan synthase beta chain
MNEALRDWVTNVESTYYLIGTAAGPHPYPEMVRDFQSVIGTGNARADAGARRPPAGHRSSPAVGGGSNAIGLFHPFLDDEGVGSSASKRAGRGIDTSTPCTRFADRRIARACSTATAPICFRMPTGRSTKAIRSRRASTIPASARSIRGCTIPAGSTYVPIMDREALDAFQLLTRLEGIIPALEPSHALAEVIKRAPRMDKDQIIVMNLCGRGDKDVFTAAKALGVELG